MKPDPLVGATLEKCRLLSRLGRGGMGSVYLAEHEVMKKKVAVKILPDYLASLPESVERFKREAMTAGRLDHPNIAQVYDVGYASGKHFIVMQYIEGESLQTVVDTLGCLEPRDACGIAAQILHGLYHAHKAGIVHRDIKPDNVLLTAGNQAKLLDFGLAVEFEDSVRLTTTGSVVGTPDFLSPEQAKGLRAESRSDIYSVGVTLYYLLTGKLPHSGETPLAILNKHIQETPISPGKINPRIPLELNEIVLRLMAKKPEDRPLTALEAARDLERFLEGKWTVRQKPAPPPRRRSAWLFPVAAAGVASLLLAAALLVPRTGSGNPSPLSDPKKPDPPPPSSDPFAKAREQLQEILDFGRKYRDDYASFPDVVQQYDDFALKYPELKETVETARKKYVEEIVEPAAELEAAARRAEARKHLDADRPAEALRELRDFPIPLLKISNPGREIHDEIHRLVEEIRNRHAENRRRLDRLLRENRILSAQTLLGQMEEEAEAEHLPEIRDLKRTLAERERGLLEEAEPRLRKELSALTSRIAERLVARDPATALELLRHRAEQAKESEVERQILLSPRVQYDRLPEGLDEALAGADDEPRLRLLLLFRDAFEFSRVPASATPRAFAASGSASPGLVGLAYLYSEVPDRHLSAQRWLLLAKEQGEVVPDFRLEDVAAAAVLEREAILDRHFSRARREAAEGNFDTARKTAADGRKTLTEMDTLSLLEESVRQIEMDIFVREIRSLLETKATARALEKIAELRREFEDLADPGLVENLHARGLFDTGSWTRTPVNLDPKNDFWGWDGKRTDPLGRSAPAPASVEEGGFRLKGGRLIVNPGRAGRYTGFSTTCRLNTRSESPDFGFLFDVTDQDRSYKLLLVRANAVEILNILNGGSERVAYCEIEKPPPVGEWIDFGFVVDGKDVVVTYRRAFAIRTTMILSEKSAIGLYSRSDVTFKEMKIRK